MTQPIKLLVVDDDVRFLNAISQRLQLRDFAVTVATSGRGAIDCACGHPFDLALVCRRTAGDYEHELLALLRRQRPSTEIVILAGEATASDLQPSTLLKHAETTELVRVLKDAFLRLLQRRLGVSRDGLCEMAQIDSEERSLSTLRKLRELSAQLPT